MTFMDDDTLDLQEVTKAEVLTAYKTVDKRVVPVSAEFPQEAIIGHKEITL